MYPYDILGFFPLCGKNPFDLMWLIGDLLICMIWGKCNLLLFKCMWFDKVNHDLSLNLILHVNFSLNFGCCHTSFRMEKASFYECLVLLVQYIPRALAFKTILQNACRRTLSIRRSTEEKSFALYKRDQRTLSKPRSTEHDWTAMEKQPRKPQ